MMSRCTCDNTHAPSDKHAASCPERHNPALASYSNELPGSKGGIDYDAYAVCARAFEVRPDESLLQAAARAHREGKLPEVAGMFPAHDGWTHAEQWAVINAAALLIREIYHLARMQRLMREAVDGDEPMRIRPVPELALPASAEITINGRRMRGRVEPVPASLVELHDAWRRDRADEARAFGERLLEEVNKLLALGCPHCGGPVEVMQVVGTPEALGFLLPSSGPESCYTLTTVCVARCQAQSNNER